jgi:hypothetical protein
MAFLPLAKSGAFSTVTPIRRDVKVSMLINFLSRQEPKVSWLAFSLVSAGEGS